MWSSIVQLFKETYIDTKRVCYMDNYPFTCSRINQSIDNTIHLYCKLYNLYDVSEKDKLIIQLKYNSDYPSFLYHHINSDFIIKPSFNGHLYPQNIVIGNLTIQQAGLLTQRDPIVMYIFLTIKNLHKVFED
jgi:hypothetical protein